MNFKRIAKFLVKLSSSNLVWRAFWISSSGVITGLILIQVIRAPWTYIYFSGSSVVMMTLLGLLTLAEKPDLVKIAKEERTQLTAIKNRPYMDSTF